MVHFLADSDTNNYISTMLRTSHKLILWNIWKYKGISARYIFGLSVGMASSILLLLWVNYHRQFDKFHEDSDHVYRVIQHIKFEDITIIVAFITISFQGNKVDSAYPAMSLRND